MFATLLGPLPRPPVPAYAPPEEVLDACLALQVDHGLEPLTDGGWPLLASGTVASWVATAERAGGGLVKAVLAGPLSAGQTAEATRGIGSAVGTGVSRSGSATLQ